MDGSLGNFPRGGSSGAEPALPTIRFHASRLAGVIGAVAWILAGAHWVVPVVGRSVASLPPPLGGVAGGFGAIGLVMAAGFVVAVWAAMRLGDRAALAWWRCRGFADR